MVKSVAARMDGQLMDIDRGAVYNNAFLQFLTINTQFLYQQLDLFFSGHAATLFLFFFFILIIC